MNLDLATTFGAAVGSFAASKVVQITYGQICKRLNLSQLGASFSPVSEAIKGVVDELRNASPADKDRIKRTLTLWCNSSEFKQLIDVTEVSGNVDLDDALNNFSTVITQSYSVGGYSVKQDILPRFLFFLNANLCKFDKNYEHRRAEHFRVHLSHPSFAYIATAASAVEQSERKRAISVPEQSYFNQLANIARQIDLGQLVSAIESLNMLEGKIDDLSGNSRILFLFHKLVGLTLLLKDDFESASTSFRAAVVLEEEDAESWAYLAQSSLRANNFDEAEEHSKVAYALAPQSSLARATRIGVLGELKRFEEHDALLDEIPDWNSDVICLLARGHTAMVQLEFLDAQNYYRHALKLDGQNVFVISAFLTAVILQLQADEHEKRLEPLTMRLPSNTASLDYCSALLESAFESLRGMENENLQIRCLVLKIAISALNNDDDACVKACDEILSLNFDQRILLSKAHFLLAQNKLQESEQTLMLLDDLDSIEAEECKICILLQQNRSADALPLLKKHFHLNDIGTRKKAILAEHILRTLRVQNDDAAVEGFRTEYLRLDSSFQSLVGVGIDHIAHEEYDEALRLFSMWTSLSLNSDYILLTRLKARCLNLQGLGLSAADVLYNSYSHLGNLEILEDLVLIQFQEGLYQAAFKNATTLRHRLGRPVCGITDSIEFDLCICYKDVAVAGELLNCLFTEDDELSSLDHLRKSRLLRITGRNLDVLQNTRKGRC